MSSSIDEDPFEVPLCLDSAEYAPTPPADKSCIERTYSGTSDHSFSEHSCREITPNESHKTESSGNKSSKDVPSTSVTSAGETCVPVVKKKKVKKSKYYCRICNIDLQAVANYRSHRLGKQHAKKAVPQMKSKFCITVLYFNPDTTEEDLFDYFSIVGAVETVFISRGEESYGVIEFVYQCCVDHAVECLAGHVLHDSKLALIKGLPFGKIQSNHLDITPHSGKLSCPQMFALDTELKETTCDSCNVLLHAGDSRKHYLSKEHTRNAYSRINAKGCINVAGFQPETSVRALYDYFSHSGRVITIVIFREKKILAVVEFLHRCSVRHVIESHVPHILGNTRLIVGSGIPFGGCLPNMPAFLCEDYDPLKNSLITKAPLQQGLTDKVSLKKSPVYEASLKKHRTYEVLLKKSLTVEACSKKNVTAKAPSEKNVTAKVPTKKNVTTKAPSKASSKTNKTPLEKSMSNNSCLKKSAAAKTPLGKSLTEEGLGSQIFSCHICKATFNAGRLRHHYLSETHIEKTVPLMRESSCITVSGFPPEISLGALYDYFSSFEKVRTIDTRRQKAGFAVVEFESEYPLRNVVDCVTTQVMGDNTLTIIRGWPSLRVPVQSYASPDKEKCHKEKQKKVDCGRESQPVSSVNHISDRVIQNEFENAMKSLQIQEPLVKTVVENHVPNNTKSSTTKLEIKTEVDKKPMLCDVCNVFYKAENFRGHHISQKHNKNAVQYMNEKCCLSAKGFLKDTKLEALYDCFSRFGNVKVVVIHKKKELEAIVEFYEIVSVKQALKVKTHVLGGRKLYVQHGQPKYNGGKPLESLPCHATLLSSLKKYNTVHDQILCMQPSLLLSEKNMKARIDLCNLVRAVLNPFFPHCVLHLFGSSVNSFGMKGGDVDILFEVFDKPNAVEQECNYSKFEIKSPGVSEVMDDRFPMDQLAFLPRVIQLDFIKKVLRRYPHEFHTVVLVPSLACPIVKFVSIRFGLCCDLSNGNRMSLCNTGLLHFYGRLDKRVIPLATTLRYWAKRFNYIGSRNFSSYAFTLMVIFFLQTRKPPILPSLKLLRSQTDRRIMVDGFDCSFCSDKEKIEPSTNIQTLGNLLLEFFEYYGTFAFNKFVVSPLTGSCEPVENFSSNENSSISDFKVSAICIQDPFLTSRNVSSHVNESVLANMTDHFRKILREREDYFRKQEKSGTGSCSTRWDILQLFDVIPKQTKARLPKTKQNISGFTMIKIKLNEKAMASVQNKYNIGCTQCVNLTEIALHEICCFVIDLMHQVLLFNVEITVDKRNHVEFEKKAQTLHYSCSCGETCNDNLSDVTGDVQNEQQAKYLCEMNDSSCSADLSSSIDSGSMQNERLEQNVLKMADNCCSSDPSSSSVSGDLLKERLEENYLEMNGSSCSSGHQSPSVGSDALSERLTENYLEINEDSCSAGFNSSSVQSNDKNERCTQDHPDLNESSCSNNSSVKNCNARYFSDEVNVLQNVKMQGEPSTVSKGELQKHFDVKEHEPFLCITFTAIYQTWHFRNKYRKQCNRNAAESLIDFEKCVSEKIAKDKTLQMKCPAEFKCEFYDYHTDTSQFLYLKMTPPELKSCWRPVTSFLKLYLPKMVESSL